MKKWRCQKHALVSCRGRSSMSTLTWVTLCWTSPSTASWRSAPYFIFLLILSWLHSSFINFFIFIVVKIFNFCFLALEMNYFDLFYFIFLFYSGGSYSSSCGRCVPRYQKRLATSWIEKRTDEILEIWSAIFLFCLIYELQNRWYHGI